MNHFWSLNWIVKDDFLVSFPAKTETGLDNVQWTCLDLAKEMECALTLILGGSLIPADDQLGLGFDAERCVH